MPLPGHRIKILGDKNNRVVLGHTYDNIEPAIYLADPRFDNTLAALHGVSFLI